MSRYLACRNQAPQVFRVTEVTNTTNRVCSGAKEYAGVGEKCGVMSEDKGYLASHDLISRTSIIYLQLANGPWLIVVQPLLCCAVA